MKNNPSEYREHDTMAKDFRLGWIALILCIIPVLFPGILCAEWITIRAATSGNVGQYTDIAIDSGGCPHISHYDVTNGDLLYTRWTGAAWVTERVDVSGFAGRYSSIALDSLEYPHIAYYDGTDKNLKYAYKSLLGGEWVKETVESDNIAGLFCSLALDSSNRPHICYYQEISADNTKVRYAVKNLGSWAISTIENLTVQVENTGTSLFIDSADKPHVSYQIYFKGNHSELKYATKPGATWNIQIVDQSTTYYDYAGLYSSLAMGSDGYPRIAYINQEGNFALSYYLKMAQWNGTEWKISSIQTGLSPFRYSSLVLGSFDLPRIAYYDDSGKNLRIASKNIMSGWTFTKVDETGNVGDFCSMTQDAQGRAHISYQDATDGDLKYARQNDNPTLQWLGISRYMEDGLHPEEGIPMQTSFDYRVQYQDANNDAPLAGYPKVHILKGGVETPGSPFSMEYVSGEYDTGAVYSYSQKLLPGSDYSYRFEAFDVWQTAATGFPTSPLPAPDVKNTSPTLEWTGEAHYVSDGIHPDNGPLNQVFTYRVRYSDADNDEPTTGCPRVHIYQGGIEIDGSPAAMLQVTNDYVSGALYTFQAFLPTVAADYTYVFEARDKWGYDAAPLPGTGPAVGPEACNGFALLGVSAGGGREEGPMGVRLPRK